MKIVFAACLAAVITTPAAQAADVKVLASPNMRPLLTDVAPELEKSGQTLVVTYDSAGAVKNRAAGGEDTDVVITLRPLLDELAAQGTAKGVATIGRSFIAVVVPTGAPKPDISSPEAFKRALQTANSVVHSDPAKGGLSGIFTARMIERFGLAEEMKSKIKLVPPGGVALPDAVARKEADFGIDQLTVVDGKPGVELVGVLSPQFGVDIVMGAGISARSKAPDGAAAVVNYLTSPAAAPLIKKRGMEPG